MFEAKKTIFIIKSIKEKRLSNLERQLPKFSRDQRHENIWIERCLEHFQRTTLENDKIDLVECNDLYNIRRLIFDWETFLLIDNKFLEMYSDKYTNRPKMEMLLHPKRRQTVNLFRQKLLHIGQDKRPSTKSMNNENSFLKLMDKKITIRCWQFKSNERYFIFE